MNAGCVYEFAITVANFRDRRYGIIHNVGTQVVSVNLCYNGDAVAKEAVEDV